MSYEKKYLPLDSDIKEEWDEREDRVESATNSINTKAETVTSVVTNSGLSQVKIRTGRASTTTDTLGNCAVATVAGDKWVGKVRLVSVNGQADLLPATYSAEMAHRTTGERFVFVRFIDLLTNTSLRQAQVVFDWIIWEID